MQTDRQRRWQRAKALTPEKLTLAARARSLATATEQQKAKGRRITSPVLLPLTAGDGI